MGLLNSLIMTACVGLSGQSKEACVKGLQAASKQSGVEKRADSFESHQTKIIENAAYDYVGKDAVQAVGGVGFATQSVVSKKASIGLPNLGICSKMSLEVNQNTQKLLLQWRF
jgi:hypothetical protein